MVNILTSFGSITLYPGVGPDTDKLSKGTHVLVPVEPTISYITIWLERERLSPLSVERRGFAKASYRHWLKAIAAAQETE